MCNEAARRASLGLIRDDFSQVRITLRFPEGLPNLASLDSIRITDPAAIVRAVPGSGADTAEDTAEEAELVLRRWSWGGAGGKPVYNFRSEGRRFGNTATGGRCLIPLDGFYEFTDPGTAADTVPDLLAGAGPARAPARGRKDKWLFTMPSAGPGADTDRALFCVAGLWRAGVAIGSAKAPATGEAFTMLTCDPGPDIAPYHARQIVLMPRENWAAWLAGDVPAADLIAPTPAGTLRVEPAR